MLSPKLNFELGRRAWFPLNWLSWHFSSFCVLTNRFCVYVNYFMYDCLANFYRHRLFICFIYHWSTTTIWDVGVYCVLPDMYIMWRWKEGQAVRSINLLWKFRPNNWQAFINPVKQPSYGTHTVLLYSRHVQTEPKNIRLLLLRTVSYCWFFILFMFLMLSLFLIHF